MKRLTLGILANVDAGKTTLSEELLYESGAIRKKGRVDHGDAFLDTFDLEKSRGITIFSKQAMMIVKDTQITLLDTPGHVDFSTEMERTLSVLDYAILVISGADGVEAHTQTLWKLLTSYEIPVFIFVNKMDQEGTNQEKLMTELQKKLDSYCIDFTQDQSDEFYENIAVCEEELLEEFLENGKIEIEEIKRLIKMRKVFPCYFGSALKGIGVSEFLENIEKYTREEKYPSSFSARVFKITRDEMGNRLTYLKILGGTLKARDLLNGEKVNQIRIYSGEKYEAAGEAEAGMICALTGLSSTYVGQGLGEVSDYNHPVLEPVLNYRVLLPRDCSPAEFLPKLRQLEEEDPMLHVVWNEELQEIQVQLMGEVQIEILKTMIRNRFEIPVDFGEGSIVYKESIENTVEGVGHYEPLRHYAEVHLLLEPNRRGGGVEIDCDCSEDVLDKNWQRLILTHLKEREYRGVLTGSVITDIKITVIAGRAHQKHTEGGDFRQATYRAVRQGLMQAQSILLEPYYEFELQIPNNLVGRAMMDLEKMKAIFESPQIENNMAILTGKAPVICMQGYQKEVSAYTKGEGSLSVKVCGYERCHNEEEVLETVYYDPELDAQNPSYSVFCAHGSGFAVPWYEVFDYMHLPLRFAKKSEEIEVIRAVKSTYQDEWIDNDEVEQILNRTFSANKKEKSLPTRGKKVITAPSSPSYSRPISTDNREEYLLVDGYNIIFAWEDLSQLAKVNINSAREKLQDILCNYQGMKGCQVIVVFDAYRVQGHQTEILDYHNIHVVYTKEAETADQYIEKFAHEKSKKYKITVATSDGLEQIIIRGQGCLLLSAREFEKEVHNSLENLRQQHLQMPASKKNYLIDALTDKEKEQLNTLDSE
jgi:small GTP-binding protein